MSQKNIVNEKIIDKNKNEKINFARMPLLSRIGPGGVVYSIP